MKKLMFSLMLLLIAFIIPTTTVSAAQTIAEMQKELDAAQKKLDDINSQKALNNQSINETNNKINKIQSNIEEINTTITVKTNESVQLEKDIVKKNDEIKDLMRYYQVSSSGSAMLEYIMGAKSLTDLIYRLSITEQISTYNKNKIKEMNDMIDANERLKKELSEKKQELASLKSELQTQLIVLNQKQSKLSHEGKSQSESIKEMKEQIKYYKSIRCRDDETVSACYARVKGSGYLPSGTTFYRPTTSGRMSSGFGKRTLRGALNNHFAVDISMSVGTPVYSVASGVVTKVIHYTGKESGGNQIVIRHYVNGKYYTSYYCHLSVINVTTDQVVTKDTIIGKSGNTGNTTGPHLHLGMATGIWYQDYYDYYEYGRGSFQSHTFDPREVITFPPIGSSYSNR